MVGKVFGAWIKDRIEQFGFTENQDFVVDSPILGNQAGRGGDRRSKEYHLTLDTAKELAMLERNDRGKQSRQYFIECERRLWEAHELGEVDIPGSLITPAREFRAAKDLAFAVGLEGNQATLAANRAVRRVTGVDCLQLLDATHLIAERQVLHFSPKELAARFGKSPQWMNKVLSAAGFQEKAGDKWLPTEKGKKFAVLLDTGKSHGSGVPIQQLKWCEDVLEALEVDGMTKQ